MALWGSRSICTAVAEHVLHPSCTAHCKPTLYAVQHYPGRLQQLYVVDLPVVLKWVVAAVKPVLHPETRAKICVCQPPSANFPLPSSVLDFSASTNKGSLPANSQAPSQVVLSTEFQNVAICRISDAVSF